MPQLTPMLPRMFSPINSKSDCQIHHLLKLQGICGIYYKVQEFHNVCKLHKHYQHHVQFHVHISSIPVKHHVQ